MRRLRKTIASLASLAVLTSAMPAQANNNCDLIRAFKSKDGKGLRKLSIATNRDGQFDILIGGKKTPLRGADTCEINGPFDEFELQCEWDMNGGEREAVNRARALMALFSPCLTDGWREPGKLYQGTTGAVISEYRAEIEVEKGDEEFEVQLEIEVWRFSNRYQIEVEVSRYR